MPRLRYLPMMWCAVASGAWSASVPVVPQLEHDEHGQAPVIQGVSQANCVDGVSGGYACRNIEMLSRLTLEDLGGASGNDSWGWKDPLTGSYYALMGLDNGVSFIDITIPRAPVVVGRLPSQAGSSIWRDVKTYTHYALVVADDIPEHGMQIFDLRRLRDATPQEEFSPDAWYQGFGPAHNVAVNEDSGFAYAVGTDTCSGGLHMVDIRDPEMPLDAGCYEGDGYTHDVHCVTYEGTDADFRDREVCFASNEDSLTIVDVTDKNAPSMIGKLAYPVVGYSHQGWVSDDHRYFLLGDELDELDLGMNVRTLVFDVSDLEEPVYAGAHIGGNSTTDHNLYVHGHFVYQANYTSGLRILLAEDLRRAKLREIAYFDTLPSVDERGFAGAWNVYPFFDNGVLLVSDLQSGLFILRAALPAAEAAPINGRLTGAYITPGLNDQGLALFVGENIFGPYVYFAWFTYLGGQPFWLSGAAPFEYGADQVDIPTQRLEGLGFLEPGDDLATRIDIGTLHVHAHGCNILHLEYDFAPPLGSGQLDMYRLVSVQGRECPD